MQLSKLWSIIVLFSLLLLAPPLNFLSTQNYTEEVIQEPVPDIAKKAKLKRFPSSYNLEQYQKNLLSTANMVARSFKLPPGLLQGIIWQESTAGAAFNTQAKMDAQQNKSFLGVAQISIGAVKAVFNKWPNFKDKFNITSDSDIRNELITNDLFNITMAAKYLQLMNSFGFKSPAEMALAYNQGPGGAAGIDPNEHPYSLSVMNHARVFSKWN